jgi:hypothetical protein
MIETITFMYTYSLIYLSNGLPICINLKMNDYDMMYLSIYSLKVDYIEKLALQEILDII